MRSWCRHVWLRFGITAAFSHATRAIPEISVSTFSRGKKKKNDFSSYNGHRSGEIKLTGGGPARRKLHGIGVNNGDVTAGRRTTERQDNGLLSPFSVLAAPLHLHLFLSFLLSGDFLLVFYRTISSTAVKQKSWPAYGILEDRPNVWLLEGHTRAQKGGKKSYNLRPSGAKSSPRVKWLARTKIRRLSVTI